METDTISMLFVFNSILLGAGLAMDAFSVSLADGLNETHMTKRRMTAIAGTFAFFQALMPLLGWLAVHTILQVFSALQNVIPWIAFFLLGYIGINMWTEKNEAGEEQRVSGGGLLLQGIATSIDALSVGFTIAEYPPFSALVCALIIAAVTFVICMGGLYLGRKTGTKLADKANKLGGTILILIGLEILLKHLFF